MALPLVGSVHPEGVDEVTEPSTTTTRRRPAVGVNAVPDTTLVPDDGSTVWEVVPLRGAAITTLLSQRAMIHPLAVIASR